MRLVSRGVASLGDVLVSRLLRPRLTLGMLDCKGPLAKELCEMPLGQFASVIVFLIVLNS